MLVYDDDCGFCTRFAKWANDRGVSIRGFSELTLRERELLPDEFEDCSHFIVGDEVYSCGESIEKTLEATHPPVGGTLRLISSAPGFEVVREKGYALFAANRGRF